MLGFISQLSAGVSIVCFLMNLNFARDFKRIHFIKDFCSAAKAKIELSLKLWNCYKANNENVLFSALHFGFSRFWVFTAFLWHLGSPVVQISCFSGFGWLSIQFLQIAALIFSACYYSAPIFF